MHFMLNIFLKFFESAESGQLSHVRNARKWNVIFIFVEFYPLFDSQKGCTTAI